jgi:hypothetical protein
MLHIKAFSRPILVALLVAASGCGPFPGSASAESTKDQSDQITQFKEKLWAAIREKNAQKFIDCFFIEKRFNTPDVRETNRKQIDLLLGRETIALELEEISDKDMAEIRKIQNAKADTVPRYSLLPRKMILLRQKSEAGQAGRRFLIGERNGQWYIVTMAGYTT